MQWGFDVNQDTLRLCYGSERWYKDSTAFTETFPREEGQYYMKGDVLWHMHGNDVTRIHGDQRQHYTVEESGPVAVSKDAFYICEGKECKRASNNQYDVYTHFPSVPENIYYCEAGLLYKTSAGIYTPSNDFLVRDLHYFDTHEGVFVGVTSWGMKIWFTASWRMHHRIAIPGKAVDISCTVPWVCVVTQKNTCSIWNVHTGEAYRQWSLHHPRSVTIDHAAQVISCTRDEISFYDDTGTCLYAQKYTSSVVVTTNDTTWVLGDDDIKRVRPVDPWSLQVCMWCETPLTLPFPAPPSYVLPTVEHILDALKIYWLPRSFENLATERTTPHLTDFMQIVDMNEWATAFFEFAAGRSWQQDHVVATRRRLSKMGVEIDVHAWANVEHRQPSDESFALWDILFHVLDEESVDVITLACDHKRDVWLASRAEESAMYVVHPYLIDFLPCDTFITIMKHHWNEWVPVFLEWIQTHQTMTSRRMWRMFLKHLSINGPVSSYPDALRIMDTLASWKRGNCDASCVMVNDLYCFDPSFHPTRPVLEHILLEHSDIIKEHVDVLLDIASPLVKHLHTWNIDIERPERITVMQHEEMFIWSDKEIYRRNNQLCTATMHENASPIDVDVLEDQVCAVYDNHICIYKLGLLGMVYSFPRHQIICACYESRERLWILSIHGVLECIHTVNGKTLARENTLFSHARSMQREDERLFIICTTHVHIYDIKTAILVNSIATNHVIDVATLFGQIALVYEDNTICYAHSKDPICATDFRPTHVQEVSEHVVVVTSVSFRVYNDEWEIVYEETFESTVADVCYNKNVWYILLRNGNVRALQWNRHHLARAQEILFELDTPTRYAQSIIDILMLDTSLYDTKIYLCVVERLMEDRTTWPLLLREDVFRWLLDSFFQNPAVTWTPLWSLFSFRGTTVKCVICQSTSVSESNPLVLLQCGHRFHRACVEQLRTSHETRNQQLMEEYALTAALACPICRAPLSTAYDDRECTLLATYDSDEEV